MNLPHIILASKSPRRKQILTEAGFNVTVEVREVEENYPSDLNVYSIPSFLAEKKANAFGGYFNDKVVVTSDTIVILQGEVLGKPENHQQAIKMLEKISGKKHDVVTGVCLLSNNKRITFSELTEVHFKGLSSKEIEYYVSNFNPTDKAGAYGIQEWIGMIGVTKIIGSYYNVMGFPIQRFYEELQKL